MGYILKDINFTAGFETYLCDTTNNDIIITLPDPLNKELMTVGILKKVNINKIMFSGYTISNVNNLQLMNTGDIVQLIVIDGNYNVINSNGDNYNEKKINHLMLTKFNDIEAFAIAMGIAL